MDRLKTRILLEDFPIFYIYYFLFIFESGWVFFLKKHLASGSARIGAGTKYTKTQYRYRIDTDPIYV
jgi:hypothetical protein